MTPFGIAGRDHPRAMVPFDTDRARSFSGIEGTAKWINGVTPHPNVALGEKLDKPRKINEEVVQSFFYLSTYYRPGLGEKVSAILYI